MAALGCDPPTMLAAKNGRIEPKADTEKMSDDAKK